MNGNQNPTKRPIQKAMTEWETTNNKKLSEEPHVNLIFNGISDIDSATLNSFTACVKLSLSSNFISKMQDIHLKNIKILSLGRNKIK
jgi:Leucine-rich repeat (LRR) protein